MESSYDVVWPQSPRGVQSARQAQRCQDLSTSTVAFLWDNVFRGDELFPVLRTELETQHPGITVLDYSVFGNTHGADEHDMISALPQNLRNRNVDAVVSGMGC